MSSFLDDKGLNKFFQAIKAKFDTRYLNGPANSLIEQNKKSFLKVWRGTADEFKQVETKESDTAYLVEGESADAEYAPITHAARHSKDGVDPITPTAIGAVGYDAAQSLTDNQKLQARGNIGAAPDGYGLGGDAKVLTPDDNLDALMTGGLFQYNRDNPPKGTLPTALAGYASLIRVSAEGNTCIQEAFDSTDSSYHGTVLRRTIYGLGTGAKIYPWEWVNPPIQLGIEYRTTERYFTKPVYFKMIDFGVLPANTKKAVAHGIDNLGYVLDYSGSAGHWVSSSIPWVSNIEFTNTNIEITTNADEGAYATKIILKYFKTTD